MSGDTGDGLALLDLPRERIAKLFAFRDWIVTGAREISETPAIVQGVGEGFREVGLQLDRMMTAVEVRHSTHIAVLRVWEPGAPPIEIPIPHGPESEKDFETSPFAAAHATNSWVRFDPRTTDPTRFGVVTSLGAEGFTDYLCVPFQGAGGLKQAFTFATKAPGGFSSADMAILRFALPGLGCLMDLLTTRRILAELARIYLGAEPAGRVLAGDVKRGAVMAMRAVIVFADMRRFTDTSMRLTTQQTVDLLNHYYDCVVEPVEARGGEVLKFIADGVLAIFRVDAESHEGEAVASALTASRAALEKVAAINRTDAAPAKFDIGIALHLGEAAYGNVGSGERQDYTVIGRDVNIASRIAGLCGELGEPLLLSESCATALDDGATRVIGRYELKGVPGGTAVYGA